MSSPITSPFGTIPSSPTAPTPQAGGGQNVGDLSQQLAKIIQMASGQAQGNIVNRPLVGLPGQLPPQHHEAGDVSGNFVNPSTIGGPARNARVTMAASIGKLVANVENQQELKKARDIAFDMQRIQTAMSNPTPENQALVNEILSDPKKRKEIQSALNINFFGGDDKRKPHQKQAIQIWKDINQQGEQQQQNGQPQGQPNAQPQQQQGGTNYFQQLQHMMPQALQLSPEATVQAEMVKLGIVPESNEQLKALTKLVSDDTRYKETVDKLNTQIDIANQKDATEQQKEAGRNARTTINNLGRIKDATIRANATVAAASVRANAENQRTQALNQINQLRVSVSGMNDQIQANNKIIVSAQRNIEDKVAVDENTKLIKQLQDTNQQLGKTISSLASGATQSGGNSNTGTSTGTDTKSSSDPTKLINDYLDSVEKGLSSSDDEDE